MVDMPRYADPSTCPDCRAPLGTAPARCARCGLPLLGETAAELFATLTRADQLVDALRRSADAAGQHDLVPPAAGRAGRTAAGRRVRQSATGVPRPAGLSAASVPTILLGLGAGCLLVAALVFLAVTWSVLGVGGRTATLAGITAVAAVLAAAMARRGLRAATESLALVAFGLLALDLLGAERAGWLGEPTLPGLLQLVGAVLVATGGGAAAAARRTAVGALTSGEAVAVLGTALLALGVAGAEGSRPALLLAAVALALLVHGAAHRLGLPVLAPGAAAVGVASWVALTGYALDRALAPGTGWRELWLGAEVWPLLAAAGLAAAPAAMSRLPRPLTLPPALCTVGAMVAHLLLTVAVLAPTLHRGTTTLTVVAVAVLAGTGLVTWLLPRGWAVTQSLTVAAAAAGVLSVATALTLRSLGRLAEASTPPWRGGADDSLPRLSTLPGELAAAGGPAAWLLPLCALALCGTVVVLRLRLRPGPGGTPPDADLPAAVVGGSLVATLALYPVPVWWLLLALVALAAAGTVRWLRTRAVVPVAVAVGALAVATGVSLHAELLTALVLPAGLLLALTVHLRGEHGPGDRSPRAVPGLVGLAGAAAPLLLAGDVWAWGAVADADPSWVALGGLVALALVVLLPPYAPARWWRHGDPAAVRVWTEAGAALAALTLAAAALAVTPVGDRSGWAAVYLTVAGGAVTALSLLRRDRRAVAWAGGALLAAATWVRLADLGVSAPEPYTLPSAVVLLLVGLHRLHRDPTAPSMTSLAPGLTLALLPSLLWVLDEPAGLRALLLGAACLLLVLGGSRSGWTAPLTFGAAIGAALVLRLGAPYVGDAVPRWLLIGAAGVLLLTVGTTWERRVSEARAVLGYVRALR